MYLLIKSSVALTTLPVYLVKSRPTRPARPACPLCVCVIGFGTLLPFPKDGLTGEREREGKHVHPARPNSGSKPLLSCNINKTPARLHTVCAVLSLAGVGSVCAAIQRRSTLLP